MFPLASFFFSLLGLASATYTDFRDRTIPNGISLGMGLLGLGFAAYESYLSSSVTPLLAVGGVVLATYVVAYLFWRLGAWAGGDVKLFVGLAALNPFNPFILGTFFHLSFSWAGRELIRASSLPLFMLNLFIFSVVMLIPYTALLSLAALKTKEHRRAFFSSTQAAVLTALEYALILVSIKFVLDFFQMPLWSTIVFIVILSFLPRLARAGVALAGVIILALSLFSFSIFVSVLGVILLVDILFSWYGFARRYALSHSKKISDLKDGDISGELIVVKHGSIVREPAVSFQTIIKAGFQRDLGTLMAFLTPEKGEILASPRQAAGLYPDQIARLQHEVKQGRLENRILVKASSPFAPAVLLAYVFLTLAGDGPLSWGFG